MSTAAAAPAKSTPTPPSKFVPSQLLELSSIEPDPHNPRKDFPKEALAELAASIGLHGVLSPIEVRPVGNGKHRIVFGERRYRAAKLAGLEKVPAIVRQLTDLQAAEEQLDENVKRAELSPLEVAGGYQRQLDLGRTMDQVCERAGKKRSAVYSAIALLKLGPEAKKAIGEEQLDAETAKLLVKYVPKSMQADQVKVLTGQGKDRWGQPLEAMSYREAHKHLTGFVVDLKKAPFDMKSEEFGCIGKSCAVCPNRTGNNPDLYDDVKSPDLCVDRQAYAGKLHLFRKKELEKKGVKLLSPAEAPVDELFWNTHGGLRPDSGYVEPKDRADGDAKYRSYAELLEPEQLKKLTVVALNHQGAPVELLARAGLQKELKKAGKFTSWEAEQKKRAQTRKAKEKKVEQAGPKLEELTRDVLMGKCVAAVEDKGMLSSAMLKLITRKLLGTLQWDSRLAERRGMKKNATGAFHVDAKQFDKAFPKLTPGKLAGLAFEAAFDDAFEPCEVDDMMTEALDACELLGVDAQKVADQVKAEQDKKKLEAAMAPKAAKKGKTK